MENELNEDNLVIPMDYAVAYETLNKKLMIYQNATTQFEVQLAVLGSRYREFMNDYRKLEQENQELKEKLKILQEDDLEPI